MGHDIQIEYEIPEVIDRVGRRARRLRTDYRRPLETATEVMDMYDSGQHKVPGNVLNLSANPRQYP